MKQEVNMTKAARKYFNQCWYDISSAVVDKFGGSYQNMDTLGRTWRQQVPYSPDVEDFVIYETKLCLVKVLPDYCLRDLNLSYGLCNGIAGQLSKYMAKKSPELTRAVAHSVVMQQIFFENPVFVTKFKNRYKKPIDLTDAAWVGANPGVVAMYNALNNQK